MARDVESLVLQMSADLRKFEKGMARMSSVAQQRLTQVERQAIQADRNLSRIMGRAGDNMASSLKSSLAGLGQVLAGAFSVQALTRYADAWTAGRNALAAAGVATADLAARQSELVDVANDSRTGAQETIALYTRLSIATQELGLAQGDTLRLTELLNKSFQSSGASTQEAASAALQLSQALASGTLQGDELRSLRENAPQLAQIIARSMGVGIGALKDLGAQGKITGQVVARAILGAGDQIEAKFNATQTTVSQALTILNNQLGAFIGRGDQTLSATARVAQGIEALANNLDDVAEAALAAGAVIGTALAARAVGSASVAFTALRTQVALTNTQLLAFELQSGLAAGAMGRMSTAGIAATGAMRGLNGAMAFFGGPIGLAITGILGGIAFLATESNRAKREADDLAAAVREQARAAGIAAEETARLTGEITATQTWVASLTGQTDKLADAHYRAAAAAKAQAIEEARLRLETAQTSLDQARTAFADRRRINAQAEGALVSTPYGTTPQIGGTGFNRAGDARAAGSQEFRTLVQATGVVTALTGRLRAIMEAPLAPETQRPTSTGSTNGAGSTSAADRTAQEALRRQREFDDAIAAAQFEGLQALTALATTAEQRASIAILSLDSEKQSRAVALERRVIDGDLTEAQKERLMQAEEAGYIAREANIAAELERDIQERRSRVQDAALQVRVDGLNAEREIAMTDEARLAVDRQILEIHQGERRQALERALLSAELTQAERDVLTATLAKLASVERSEAAALMSPGTAQGRDVLQGVNQQNGRDAKLAADRTAALDYINAQEADGVASHRAAMEARAQIDQEYWNARLTGEGSMLDGIASLQNSSIKELAALGKAAALAQATIQGFLAIQTAVASAPFPFNIPAIAFATAQTATNLAGIAGVGFKSGGYTGNGSVNAPAGTVHGQEFVFDAPAVRKIGVAKLEALRRGGMPSVPSAASLSGGGAQSFSINMPIDARGADLGAAARIQGTVADLERRLPGIIRDATSKQDRYRLGRNAQQ